MVGQPPTGRMGHLGDLAGFHRFQEQRPEILLSLITLEQAVSEIETTASAETRQSSEIQPL